MTFQDKLRLHLADKDVTWTFDGSRATASWHESGPRLLVGVPGPLAAATVLDAYVAAQARQAHLTVVHEGAATPVAQRAASRFGVTLLDAASWPAATLAPTPEESFAPATPEPTLEPVVMETPVAGIPHFETPFPLDLVVAPAIEAAPLLEPVEAPLLLPAHVDEPLAAVEPEATAPVVEAAPEMALEALAEVLAADAPVLETDAAPEPVAEAIAGPEPVVEAAPEPVVEETPAEPMADYIEATSYPEPVLAHASGSDDSEMPWALAAAQPEPVAVLEVAHEELAALPWHAAAPAEAEEEHHEILPGNPRARQFADHPTTAPSWGLPWPRPVTPTDGLSIADPRIWKTAERIHAVREDLDKVGAPSFGAAPTDGSAWLKRISQFGAP